MIEFFAWLNSIFTTIGSVYSLCCSSLEYLIETIGNFSFADDTPILMFVGTLRYILGEPLYYLIVSLAIFSVSFGIYSLIKQIISWISNLRTIFLG